MVSDKQFFIGLATAGVVLLIFVLWAKWPPAPSTKAQAAKDIPRVDQYFRCIDQDPFVWTLFTRKRGEALHRPVEKDDYGTMLDKHPGVAIPPGWHWVSRLPLPLYPPAMPGEKRRSKRAEYLDNTGVFIDPASAGVGQLQPIFYDADAAGWFSWGDVEQWRGTEVEDLVQQYLNRRGNVPVFTSTATAKLTLAALTEDVVFPSREDLTKQLLKQKAQVEQPHLKSNEERGPDGKITVTRHFVVVDKTPPLELEYDFKTEVVTWSAERRRYEIQDFSSSKSDLNIQRTTNFWYGFYHDEVRQTVKKE